MTDWLIIGGGIHGVHIAARLVGEVGVPRQSVSIVDPAPQLLERWQTCTSTTGMRYLRSPSVHNVGVNPWSLRQFAKRSGHSRPFAPPYDRPSLELFNRHCEHVVDSHGLDARHVSAFATECDLDCDAVRVTLSNGEELEAANVVLAMGASDQPRLPAWAPAADERFQHVFARDFRWPGTAEGGGRVAVVGGGITAAQVALRLAQEELDVHLVSRHELREHQFDSDPGWLGPRCMNRFAKESDHELRRRIIDAARHKGSAPPAVCRQLRRALDGGDVAWHGAEIVSWSDCPDGALSLELDTLESLNVDHVVFATGFESKRPGGQMIDTMIERADLPCASCGYPIVDSDLRWHPRVFVSGPLAELELGPAARNIAGARRAADRMVSAINLAS